MTATSFLGVGAALAFVLAIMALLVRALRGVALGRRASDGPELEVVARAPLAPKQGVAAVAFAGRTALVSYGEGGVRLLMEVDGRSVSEDRNGTDVPGLPAPGGASFATLLAGAAGEGAFPTAASGAAPVPPPVPAARERGRLLSRVRSALGGPMAGLLPILILGAALSAPTAAGGQVVDDPASGAQAPGAAVAGQASGSPAPVGAQADADDPDGAGRPVEDLLAEALRSMGVGGGSGAAQDASPGLTGPVGTVIFLGFLTLLPTLLLLMTSFTRILIVLHLLKQAIGTQTAPPAHLLAAMSLLLTGFVMAPTMGEVNRRALSPWMDGQMDETTMLVEASGPFRAFMLESTREADLAAFVDMSGAEPETVDDVPLVVVTSAFVTSELTNAFKMGFAIFLPFIVIDVVVASILMSMGMFMLPPVMVSLPFKLLLFVLVDGWSLVIGSLVQSFR